MRDPNDDQLKAIHRMKVECNYTESFLGWLKVELEFKKNRLLVEEVEIRMRFLQGGAQSLDFIIKTVEEAGKKLRKKVDAQRRAVSGIDPT